MEQITITQREPCTNHRSGGAIHLLVAGRRRNLKAMLPHLHRLNVARRCGYYYIEYHAFSGKACRQVEADLAANFICGKTTALALEPLLADSGFGYPHTPVLVLHERPDAILGLIEGAWSSGRVALGYFILHGPDDTGVGIAFAVPPHNVHAQLLLCEFLAGSPATQMRGAWLGPSGGIQAARDRGVPIVSAFARHLEENAVSVLDVGHTTSPPFELVTMRGDRLPLGEPARALGMIPRSTMHLEGELGMAAAAPL